MGKKELLVTRLFEIARSIERSRHASALIARRYKDWWGIELFFK